MGEFGSDEEESGNNLDRTTTAARSTTMLRIASISITWRPMGTGRCGGPQGEPRVSASTGCAADAVKRARNTRQGTVRCQRKSRVMSQAMRPNIITRDFRPINKRENPISRDQTYAIPPTVNIQSAVGKFPASTPVKMLI
jgi:hypothetical protein